MLHVEWPDRVCFCSQSQTSTADRSQNFPVLLLDISHFGHRGVFWEHRGFLGSAQTQLCHHKSGGTGGPPRVPGRGPGRQRHGILLPSKWEFQVFPSSNSCTWWFQGIGPLHFSMYWAPPLNWWSGSISWPEGTKTREFSSPIGWQHGRTIQEKPSPFSGSLWFVNRTQPVLILRTQPPAHRQTSCMLGWGCQVTTFWTGS